MMQIQLKTQADIEAIRKSCLLVSSTLSTVASHIREGITTKQLDVIAEQHIQDHIGAKPAFKGYKGFPYTLCASLNSAVVHGYCTDKPLQNGDVVSLDCGVEWNGFFGDSAFTFLVGEPSQAVQDLCRVTWESLEIGIQEAKIGNRVGDIGFAIQQFAERKHRYGIVRELVGHGLGRSLHEAPDVPNFGKKGSGKGIEEGLVIAIEPMINMGKKDIRMERDGWTIVTLDGLPSAHYEHTIVVTKSGPEKLSDFKIIIDSIENNKSLFSFKNFYDICTP